MWYKISWFLHHKERTHRLATTVDSGLLRSAETPITRHQFAKEAGGGVDTLNIAKVRASENTRSEIMQHRCGARLPCPYPPGTPGLLASQVRHNGAGKGSERRFGWRTTIPG